MYLTIFYDDCQVFGKFSYNKLLCSLCSLVMIKQNQITHTWLLIQIKHILQKKKKKPIQYLLFDKKKKLEGFFFH